MVQLTKESNASMFGGCNLRGPLVHFCVFVVGTVALNPDPLKEDLVHTVYTCTNSAGISPIQDYSVDG